MQLTEGEMPQFTELLLEISGGLLAYGAEVYRVEESLQYIGAAYGLAGADVFAIPSHVILTLRLADGSAHTQSKRIFDRATDLDKVDRLNALCRRICRDRPGCAEIRRELDELRARPTYPLLWQVVSYGVAACAFALFFGGSPWDAACAFLVGAPLKLLAEGMRRLRGNAFFSNLVCALFGAASAHLLALAFPALHPDAIIIGMLMTLVPGIVFTNAMRDFMAGDCIAGMIKLTEAILIGAGIAVGVSVSLAVLRPRLGVAA